MLFLKRVVLAMVPLYRNRTVTKTAIIHMAELENFVS